MAARDALALEAAVGPFSPRTLARVRRAGFRRFAAKPSTPASASSMGAVPGAGSGLALAADSLADLLDAERGVRPGSAVAATPAPDAVPDDPVASALVLAVRQDTRGTTTELLLLHRHRAALQQPRLLDSVVDTLGCYAKSDRQRAQQVLRAVAAGHSPEAQRALLDCTKVVLADIACEGREHNGIRELLELVEELVSRPGSVANRPGETAWIARFCLLPLHTRCMSGGVATQLARTLVCCCVGDPGTLLLAAQRVVRACSSAGGMVQAELLAELQALLDAAQTMPVLQAVVQLALPLLRRAACSQHFLLCDRALCVLRSPRVLRALAKSGSSEATFAMLVPAIAATARQHWELHTRSSALCTLQAFRVLNATAFARALPELNNNSN